MPRPNDEMPDFDQYWQDAFAWNVEQLKRIQEQQEPEAAEDDSDSA